MHYQSRPISRPALRRPLPKTGQAVQSVSGQHLGLVARLIPNGFVLASNDGELPLTMDSVFTSSEHALTLICEKLHLGDYVVPFWGLKDAP